MPLNLEELTKIYKRYKIYLVSLDLELLRFKNKHHIMDVKMKIVEEASFNTITVNCESTELNEGFLNHEKEFKELFRLKLIKQSESKVYYDDEKLNVYKYIYTDINNNHFNEIE